MAGQVSVAFPWDTAPDVTGDVVAISDPTNADGCADSPRPAAAEVAGKVAWLEWDDNDATRRCGSVGRSGNVQAAGAIGAIFTSGRDVFGAGITGSAIIPVFQLPKAGTDALRPALDAGTLNVTFSGSLVATIKDVTPSIADTLSSFSSRGVHGSNGVVKPDVAAPGDTLASAKVGSGSGVIVESGTSMATPMTAGIAALVKQSHPGWNPEQIKAAIMNTAGHDLFTQPGQTGDRYGPARVGAGRVDALAAVQTTLLAYAADSSGAVSASFGVVEAPIGRSTVTRTKTVRIQNTGNTAADVTVSYDGLINQPGVNYEVRPSTVRVRAHGSANVRVVMTVTPGELRKTIDPTMDAAADRRRSSGVDRARQFVSDASGRLLVSRDGQPVLRVPVYGAAKPVSATTARDVGSRTGAATIQLRGNGFQQGDGIGKLRVDGLGTGSRIHQQATADLHDHPGTDRVHQRAHVGGRRYSVRRRRRHAGHLRQQGERLVVVRHVDLRQLGHHRQVTIPYVNIDTNADGDPDFVVQVFNEPSTDLLTAVLFDLNTGDQSLAPVNFADGDVDTNPFDTNTLLIPVDPAAIGLTDADTTFPISYSTGTISLIPAFGSPALNGDIDQTPPVTFDVANPRVQVSSPLFYDGGGVGIPYRLGPAPAVSGTPSPAGDTVGIPAPSLAVQAPAAATDSTATGAADLARRGGGSAARPTPATALLIHLHAASGKRAEVLTLRG